MNEIADEIGGLVGWVLEHAHTRPAHLPAYLVIDMAGDMVVQVGVPVAAGETDGVSSRDLPAGMRRPHVGHPDGLYARPSV